MSPQSTVDKVIISNRSALNAKYGKQGTGLIYGELEKLIATDTLRGLRTAIFDIDDPLQMDAIGGSAVHDAQDEIGAKSAVDAIYAHYTPDYILLLDGPDVIPHIALHPIAGVNDSDHDIESDLPYACANGFSKNASNFVAVTRVVGRLPATPGETDAGKLIALIENSVKHAGRPASDFGKFFSISADVWKQSTQLSLKSIFGKASPLLVSPPDDHPVIDASLSHPIHFINCHGATADPRFYGERARRFPVAIQSARLAPHVTRGTIVAAECCFGTQLYNQNLMQTDDPICMAYLMNGAAAIWGSTNIAYGPAASNGMADLIAQFYLQSILAGASTGRAALVARQRFVQTQRMANPLNLKTLAQFVLYGDPSLHPIADTQIASETTPDALSHRKSIRSALASNGKAIASSASLPGTTSKAESRATERFRDIAKQKGYAAEPALLTVSGGAQFRMTAKGRDEKQQVMIAIEEKALARNELGTPPFPVYRAIVGHLLGDGIFSIQEYESR